MTNLATILKDSNYSISQFSPDKITRLESKIIAKEIKEKPSLYINCLVRNKEMRLRQKKRFVNFF